MAKPKFSFDTQVANTIADEQREIDKNQTVRKDKQEDTNGRKVIQFTV